MDDLWGEFFENMNRYFQSHFLSGFDKAKMRIIDQANLYSDNEEVEFDVWFLYRWGWGSDLRMGDDMVFRAHVNKTNQTFTIQRYNYDHKTSWSLDSQESHTL